MTMTEAVRMWNTVRCLRQQQLLADDHRVRK